MLLVLVADLRALRISTSNKHHLSSCSFSSTTVFLSLQGHFEQNQPTIHNLSLSEKFSTFPLPNSIEIGDASKLKTENPLGRTVRSVRGRVVQQQ